jgi:DNA-directed RNA polymerase specialized sigma24 family protein
VYGATQDGLREEPGLTQIVFARLLEWLDDGRDSQGETYLEIRRRLVTYFDRRNRPFPDDLADETFNRIARTLATDRVIAVTPPARYCYVVARFVLLEDLRSGRRRVSLDCVRESVRTAPRSEPPDTAQVEDQRLDRLDTCLEQLAPDHRELAIEYYREAKRGRIDGRRALAARLGISLNALSLRAYRIRSALEACLKGCGGVR